MIVSRVLPHMAQIRLVYMVMQGRNDTLICGGSTFARVRIGGAHAYAQSRCYAYQTRHNWFMVCVRCVICVGFGIIRGIRI